MDIRVVGDSGPLTDARLAVHITSKPYDVYHESFEVPLDGAARAVVRNRWKWNWFYLLIHNPAYYATWCAAAPGHYSQRDEVPAGVSDSTIVVRLYRAPDEPPPPGVIHEFQCTADRKGLIDPLHSVPDSVRGFSRRP